MTVNLLVLKAIAISKHGIQLYSSYRLPDSAYGEFLIYKGIRPVYYLNLFDEAYAQLSGYLQDNKVPAKQLITQILRLNGQTTLSVREAVWLSYRYFSKEEIIAYELLQFPAAYWINVKDRLSVIR